MGDVVLKLQGYCCPGSALHQFWEQPAVKRSPFSRKNVHFQPVIASYSSTLLQVDINEKFIYWELMIAYPLHNYNDLKCFQNAKLAD